LFNKFSWTKEEVTSEKLNKMIDNDKYLADYKSSGAILNQSPDGSPRGGRSILNENLAMYAEYVEFSPGSGFPGDAKKKNVSAQFEKRINFPPDFFDPEFLPVIVSTIGVRNGLPRIGHVVRNLSSHGFDVIIREHSNTNNFTKNDVYFISYVVMGVKL
jgi:hypothetical protein